MIGGGNAESLNPGLSDLNTPNFFRTFALYDSLIRLEPDNSLSPSLAVESTPNASYTTWTFRLRPDVEFHNGKTVTADDVIYSFHYMAKPSNNASSLLTNVDFAGIKKMDKRTVTVPLKSPETLFLYSIADPSTSIIPAGEKDFTKPVGTGPFRYQSFTVGQESVFLRNPNYWQAPKPYVDKITMTSISDDTARLNALLDGQINAMANLPFTEGKAMSASAKIKLLRTTGNNPYLFYMRVDVPPFNDVNVRQAIKYIVNRPRMVELALDGFGAVANDIVGQGLKYYDISLPQRSQDIGMAKSLLRKAGHQSLSLKLYTSTIQPGITQAATLLAEEATAANVKISLSNVPADAYFNTSLLYLKMPFASSFWEVPSLPAWYEEALGTNAPYNETHWHNAAFTHLLAQAQAATSPATARSLWYEVQKSQWEQGGYCVWANADNLDALASNVMGFTPSHTFPLGAPTGFINAWIA
jgi:peptide/nickel transport system substrate-binding protein